MTPYPPPATSSYPGLVQLPSGMTALSDWLDQELLASSNVMFNFVTTTDLAVTHAATIQGITFGAGLGGVSGCIGVGVGALGANVSGTRNVAIGNTSLEFLTTGIDNVSIGGGAGENIVGGGHNVFVGTDAAKLVNAGTSATAITESIVIGDAARVSGSSDANTIVIGSDGRGEGSNTTVIGNTSTTGCHLFGTLKIGDGTDATKTATLSCASITTGTNRTFTLPDASGTIVIGGGTCSGTSSGTNTGDQTSVSGNAGTATALQTGRSIYGNSFDGTADLTQIIASTYGGTGNGFTKFSGPTTSEKTKTLRDATDTILELGGSYTPTGTWTSLTMVTPVLGVPASGTLTNCTGLPVSSGISGLGAGVATALAANVGSAGGPVTFNGALGTPSSGTVTNLTGTASININGTVGATTPAAGTFTDLTINGNTIIGDASGDTVTQNASTTTIPNALTYVRKHVDSSAETLFTVRLDEDTGSSWAIVNGTANNATFAPKFQCVQSGTSVAANFTAQGTTDTGTSPVFLYVAQIGSSNVATRPCHVWRNLSTDIAQMTASYNFVLKGGTTSPVKDAATADTVALVGIDNGAGNRELQIQPESGGYFAMGNNQFRRVPTANQDVYHWTTTVNTTDATQTTLATIPITASRTYMIEARVAARRTGGSAGTADDGASYSRRGTYTTKSGTVTLMGSVQTIGTDAEDQAGWDVTMTISSTNVLVRVTGATNNNVTWMGDIKVQSVAS